MSDGFTALVLLPPSMNVIAMIDLRNCFIKKVSRNSSNMIVVIVLEIVDVSIFKIRNVSYSERTIFRNFTPTFTGNGTQLTIYIKAIII